MKQSTAPTLSAHLLRETDKILLYPGRARRTRSNLEAQKTNDKFLGILVEWRKTFAPSPQADEITKIVYNPVFLDEFYCRDLLKEVPAIVDRTVRLSHLNLSGISHSEFVYLREAASCYILGLPHAGVALARAALEDCLRNKLARLFGKKAVAAQELRYLIDDLATRAQVLSREGRTRAHKVRIAANEVLDDQAAGAPDALAVIGDAKAVIMELSRR